MKGVIYTMGVAIVIAGFTTFEIANSVNENDKKNSDSAKSTNTDWIVSFPGKPFVLSNSYPEYVEFSFRLLGMYDHPVTKEKLKSANKLGDIIAYYPENWIRDYKSVEISAVINGKEERASGTNPSINEDQKSLLQSAELATDINVTVDYKTKNVVTDNFDDHQMKITLTVIPEKEAEFTGGYDNMIRYLKENSKNEVSMISTGLIESACICFTVSADGKITDIDLTKSSGYSKIDKLMYNLVHEMPEWKPAENSEGVKVKQKFELFLKPQLFTTSLTGQDGC